MVDEQNLERLSTLSVEENKAQVRWFRHLTLVLSTLLGVVVSLRNTHSDSPLCHLSFGLATLLLSFGLCACFVLLYTYSVRSARQATIAYHNELNSAIKEHRDMLPVGVENPGWCSVLQRVCYACIGAAFLLLGVSSLI